MLISSKSQQRMVVLFFFFDYCELLRNNPHTVVNVILLVYPVNCILLRRTVPTGQLQTPQTHRHLHLLHGDPLIHNSRLYIDQCIYCTVTRRSLSSKLWFVGRWGEEAGFNPARSIYLRSIWHRCYVF